MGYYTHCLTKGLGDPRMVLSLSPNVVGGKGHGIAVMAALGLPVPPAVAVDTRACFFRNGPTMRGAIMHDLVSDAAKVGIDQGCRVSIRSGAPVSMPGMMDTVLDVPFEPDAVWDGIRRVWASYDSPRARLYRRHNGLQEHMGTAVVIQKMVYGDRDDRSGTGVMFTRNPLTGRKAAYGEWLPAARGDALVGGEKTPKPISALRRLMPDVYKELLQHARALEAYFQAPQDIEFTVEAGRLWLLQTRKLQTQEARADSGSNAAAGDGLALRGLAASRGTAEGIAVTTISDAVRLGGEGMQVILVRRETVPDDLEGIIAAAAVVTSEGGTTCHAAIVARALKKPCVVGCRDADVIRAGDRVRVDGASGTVVILEEAS